MLLAYAGVKAKVGDPQGLAAVKLNARDDPDIPKDDDEITVYGVNSKYNNIVYNNSLLSVEVFGNDLPNEQKFNAPHGITANPDGKILVADSGNDRIVELKDSGNLRWIRSFGGTGSAPGEFKNPLDVKMDSQGIFYVVDNGNNRIQIFSASGELLKIWGVDDELTFNAPVAIAVTDPLERWSFGKKGIVIIIDDGGTTIKKISLEGTNEKTITGSEFGYDEVQFAYVVMDFYNNVYVTDKKNHVIHKFNSNLDYITTFGRKGTEKNEFIEPRGIAIWRRLGQVIVAEKGTVQYYLIGTDLQDVKFENVGNSLTVSGFLTERSIIKVDIFDSNDDFVRRLNQTGRKYGPMEFSFRWNMMPGAFEHIFKELDGYKRDGEYPLDQRVPPGRYKMTIEAKPTYSSKKYFADKIEIDFILNKDGSIKELKRKESTN